MNNPQTVIASLVDVRRNFIQGDVTIEVLRGVNLSIREGELVALLGPSGTGKSTLLQALGLLEGGFTGSIKIDGEETRGLGPDAHTVIRREKLGFVYQFHHLLPDFNAIENVTLPQMIAGFDHAEAIGRSTELLNALGLGARLEHRPSQLSGGEQQRVAVARALANKPRLVLADEPTGNLDEHTADVVLGEFMALVRSEGTAAVVATHNERLAAKMDRIVRLHDGVLSEA
jgi:lipoprotein-releasing system ATP-binding protein